MAKKNSEQKLITVAIILVISVVSVIVIVTGIAARRQDAESSVTDTSASTAEDAFGAQPPKLDLPPDTSKQPDTSKIPDSTKPDEESKDVLAPNETDAEDAVAEPTPPEFVAPARGDVSKTHSETVLVYSLTTDDYRTHSGIDIAGELGDTVVAAADGIVRSVYEDPIWGVCVSVSHEGDLVSYYKNLSEESLDSLTAGDPVKRGDVIGAIGESAIVELADEPHLHFELKSSGASVDPLEYFEVIAKDITEE